MMLNRFLVFVLMCSMTPMLQAITLETLQQNIEDSVVKNGDLTKQTNKLREDAISLLEYKAQYADAIPFLEKVRMYYEQNDEDGKGLAEDIDFKIQHIKEIADNLAKLDAAIKQHGKLSRQSNDIRIEIHEFYRDVRQHRLNLLLLADTVAYFESVNDESDADHYRFLTGRLQRMSGKLEASAKNLLASYNYRIKTYGEGVPKTMYVAHNLGKTYLKMNLVEKALLILEKNQKIRESYYQDGHGKVASGLALLGEAYYKIGRVEEGERLLREGGEVLSGKIGMPPVIATVTTFIALGELYRKTGRYSESEQILQRAYLLIVSKVNKSDPLVFPIIFELSKTYIEIGRYKDAELLLNDFLELSDHSLVENSAFIAQGILQLAESYLIQNRASDAEVILKRAKKIITLVEPADSYINRLVTTYYAASLLEQGKNTQAASLLNAMTKRVTSTNSAEKEWRAFYDLQKGKLSLAQNDAKLAATYLQSSVDSYKNSLGKSSVNLGISLSYLAQAKAADGEYNEAISLFQEYFAIKSAANDSSFLKSSHVKKQGNKKEHFIINQYIDLIDKAVRSKQKLNIDPISESFSVSEYARSKSLQAAVLGMAARAAARNNVLAELVRKEQDIRLKLDINNKALLEGIRNLQGSDSSDINKELSTKHDVLAGQLIKVVGKLNSQYPEYNRLMNPKPASIKELQSVLKDDETVLSYYVQDSFTYLWIINKDSANLKRLEIGDKELINKVSKLRKALDVSISYLEDIPDYNTALAHELYTTLVAPAQKQLSTARNIIIVPHGALLSLPFGALLTKPFKLKKGAIPFTEYQNAPWLAESKAISIMPSSTALVTIRKYAKVNKADIPFIGFGDPDFGNTILDSPGQVATRGIRIAQRAILNTRSLKDLPNLPETRNELQKIAKILNAGSDSLFLGNAANEDNLRKAPLKSARVIVFATHGLVAGDIEGLEQPALALTPPENISETNDGLLDMGEVLELELNADWVILSACNTASSRDNLSSDGLTGLTQAFFYAGARTLLVSLWAVESSSTQLLTTSLFEAEQQNATIGKAAALQQARMKLIKGNGYLVDGRPVFSYAHPIFWSAFIAVGENH